MAVRPVRAPTPPWCRRFLAKACPGGVLREPDELDVVKMAGSWYFSSSAAPLTAS